MLYAVESGLSSIIAASDSLLELEEFFRLIDEMEDGPFEEAHVATFVNMLVDERFQGFKRAPLIVEHTSTDSQKAFYAMYNIDLLKHNALLKKHNEMLNDAIIEDNNDKRSLEEIYNLEQDDPWDLRTDKERADDEAHAAKMKEAQKKGDMSGDSFGPKKKGDPKVHITDLHAHTDQDGKVIIDDALAVKGFYDREEPTPEVTSRTVVPTSTVDEQDSENLDIDAGGMIAIYYKVEATGKKLVEIAPILAEHEVIIGKSTIVARNNALGCWFTFLRQLDANFAHEILVIAGIESESYAVNAAGERLVPKGVMVVDPLAPEEQHPRVWNFRAKEIKKMSKAKREENDKTLSPKEFLCIGNYEDAVHGTIIYITPRIYFKENDKMWDQPLNIAHLLPRDFIEEGPGIYRSRSRNWISISFDLGQRGFKESLGLRLHLNQLRYNL